MAHKYLEHTGDAAIEATGDTLEQAFAEAGRAMIEIMVQDRGLTPDGDIEIEASAATLEELLVEFLNELLSQQGLNDLVLTDCWVREIMPLGIDYILRGKAVGVTPERVMDALGHEVKGASYLGLKVEEKPGIYTVQCVLDM